MHDHHQSTHGLTDATMIADAWQQQLGQAATNPTLSAALRQAPPTLYRRFVRAYQEVRALARGQRRRLMRRLGLPVGGAALAFALALGHVPAAHAASIAVGGSCTLVDAITAANTDTATGGCAAGSGADTITLPANGTISLTEVNNSGAYSENANGLPVITSAITIEGNGATIARASSAPDFRIFLIGNTGDLTLNATTVTGGAAENSGSGGIGNRGMLTLNTSTVSGNNFFGITSGGTATLNNSTISGNGSGGVYNGGTATLNNTTISGNGGAGVETSGGTTTVINSTVSGNTGPGIAGSAGPGAREDGGTTTVINSTVSGNIGPGVVAGGFYSAPAINLEHSLVSGNTDGEVLVGYGTVTAGNFNLFGHSGQTNAQAFTNFTPSGSDISATSDGTNPTALTSILDTTLQNNGGPTLTHALVTGSPAVDAAPTGPDTDQRGFCRPVGAAFDIGAFERGALQPCATNSAPVATNDSYRTNEDTALSVLAPGVLGNDSDTDSDPLTAVLVSGPAHGTLTLNLDGSFSYTPAANYSGEDSFTYQANDGTATSNVATVSLTVVSALDQIDELIAQVQALVANGSLTGGQGNALIVKLEGAASYVDSGQATQAITRLQTFISQVNSFIGTGVLTAAEGQPLIDKANAIIHSLGG